MERLICWIFGHRWSPTIGDEFQGETLQFRVCLRCEGLEAGEMGEKEEL